MIHQTIFKKILLVLFVFMTVALIGCGDDDDSSAGSGQTTDEDDDDDAADDDNDDSSDDDDTELPFAVIWEQVFVEGAKAPPNPETGAETPDEFNRFAVYRFRQDTGEQPPRPVRAVIVMTPGYAAGASDFFTFGHDLVTLAQGDVEVWVADRRANLLEDQTGLDAAEAAKDPFIARDYYFNNVPVDGKTFEGYLDRNDPITEMTSEWGLDLQLEDLRKLIEMVPEENRATNVFLGGHSMGARQAQQYAAYKFSDDHLGTDDLAGILLLDTMEKIVDYTEEDYLAQIEKIRKGEVPRCGVLGNEGDGIAMIVFIQILAMATSEGWGNSDPRVGPDGFWDDWGGFSLLFAIQSRMKNVTLTNAASFGLVFDDNSRLPPNYMFGHMGRLTGGEVSEDLLGEYPSQAGATYSWKEFDECDPSEEWMDMQKFFTLLYGGPSDFTDWYYPARLDLEDRIASDLVQNMSWFADYMDFDDGRVESAVYALEGAVPAASNTYQEYRDRLPSVRGSDKPRTEEGFRIFPLNDWGHLEVLLAEPELNPFLPDFLDFVYQWSDGEVQIPPFGN